MTKRALDKILNSRITWVLVAIAAAFILHRYVIFVENPINTRMVTFQVQYEGEEQIYEMYSLRLSEAAPAEVNLNVEATYGDLQKMEIDPVIVIDLSAVQGTSDNYQAKFSVQYPSGLSRNGVTVTTSAGRNYIPLNIIQVTSKTVSIDIRDRNIQIASEDFVTQDLVVNTENLVVEGPVDIVSDIAYAAVSVNIEDPISKTTTVEAEYQLIRSDGTALTQEEMIDIVTDHETISVTIPVKMLKEVPLIIGEYTYGGGVTEENFSQYVAVNIKPSTVQIIGDASVLEAIDSIDLGSVDLTSFTEMYTNTMQIKAPDGTELYIGDAAADVSVTVSGFVTRVLSVTQISAINVTEGYTVGIETESIDVTVRGSEADVAKLEAGNVRVIVDLEEFGAVTGRHSVTEPVRVAVDSETVGALNLNYTVVIQFTKIS